METYIVRIYQRQNGESEQIVGLSEHVETGEKEGFRSLKQLNRIFLKAVPNEIQEDEDELS